MKGNRYFTEDKDHWGGEYDGSSKKVPRAYAIRCAKKNLYDF